MMNMHPGGSVKSKIFLLAIVLAGTTNLTHAHHSFAASYFPDKTITIDGKVVQFLFRNPHSFLDVAAPDEKRHDETWVVEWGGGGQLSRAGVSLALVMENSSKAEVGPARRTDGSGVGTPTSDAGQTLPRMAGEYHVQRVSSGIALGLSDR